MTRFGLQLPSFSFGTADAQIFDETLARAKAGEESGFDSVWVMDHLYQLPPLGGPAQPMLEAYTLLGAIAARTTRVRVGALVTGVTYRNPALLAKQVTTLDVISGGRAILGLGAAWYDVEHEAFGFDFPGDRERLDRLEEALQICRGMLRQPAGFSFAGAHYHVKDVQNVPAPVQAGGIPIMVGGGGEKRTLKLVARYGDFCNFSGDLSTIERKIKILRAHCEDVGRDPSTVTVSRLATLVIVETEAEATATREMLAKVAGAQAAAGFNVGTPDQVVEQIAAMNDAGVEYHTLNMPGATPEQVRRAGELLSGTFGVRAIR